MMIQPVSQNQALELTWRAFFKSGVESVAEVVLVRIPKLKPGGRFSFIRSLKLKMIINEIKNY